MQFYVNRGATTCSNKIRVRRDALEREIIGAIENELLDSARVHRIAEQLQKEFNDRLPAAAGRDADVPHALAKLDARLDRLRERLRKGDPDMEADELQISIDRAQPKRQQFAASILPEDSVRKVLSMRPCCPKWRTCIASRS